MFGEKKKIAKISKELRRICGQEEKTMEETMEEYFLEKIKIYFQEFEMKEMALKNELRKIQEENIKIQIQLKKMKILVKDLELKKDYYRKKIMRQNGPNKN